MSRDGSEFDELVCGSDELFCSYFDARFPENALEFVPSRLEQLVCVPYFQVQMQILVLLLLERVEQEVERLLEREGVAPLLKKSR